MMNCASGGKIFRGYRAITGNLLNRNIHDSCGIIGYPNIGKSTLFNAMARTELAKTENYPFCTIEGSKARFQVIDPNIKLLKNILKPESIAAGSVEVWDIAGLIKGSSEGAGLGNQFLHQIRNVNCIIHLLRCFSDSTISYNGDVENLNPIEEMQIVQTELILADLQTCQKYIQKLDRMGKGISDDHKELWKLIELKLNLGIPARDTIKLASQTLDTLEFTRNCNLLTSKPCIYVCNVEPENVAQGNNCSDLFLQFAKENNYNTIILSTILEFLAIQVENSSGSSDKELEFLNEFGQEENKIDKLLTECVELLKLQAFYSAGPEMVSSWLIDQGTKAPEAGGKIHSSFKEAFFSVEICKVGDYVEYGTEENIRRHKRMLSKGKDYVMQPGDVAIYIQFT